MFKDLGCCLINSTLKIVQRVLCPQLKTSGHSGALSLPPVLCQITRQISTHNGDCVGGEKSPHWIYTKMKYDCRVITHLHRQMSPFCSFSNRQITKPLLTVLESEWGWGRCQRQDSVLPPPGSTITVTVTGETNIHTGYTHTHTQCDVVTGMCVQWDQFSLSLSLFGHVI